MQILQQKTRWAERVMTVTVTAKMETKVLLAASQSQHVYTIDASNQHVCISQRLIHPMLYAANAQHLNSK